MKKYIILSVTAILLFTFFSCTKKSEEQNKIQTSDGSIETVEYICPSMTCTGCEDAIKKEIKKLDGIQDIKADYQSKTVIVNFQPDKTNTVQIEDALNNAGYKPDKSGEETKINTDKKEHKDTEKKSEEKSRQQQEQNPDEDTPKPIKR